MNLLKNLFWLVLFICLMADIWLNAHTEGHGAAFWHYLPWGYAIIGFLGTVTLVALVKILAASGLEQNERNDD